MDGDEVLRAVISAISEVCGIDPAVLQPGMRIADLGIDSLSAGEILVQVQATLDSEASFRWLREEWSTLSLGELAAEFGRDPAVTGEAPVPEWGRAPAQKSTGAFLLRDASDAELARAARGNHLEWLRRVARAGGGSLVSGPGLSGALITRPRREVLVAVTDAAAECLPDALQELLERCRREHVERVGCWLFDSEEDATRHSWLPSWLGARGFRWGQPARWLAVDLRAIPTAPSPAELDVRDDMAVIERCGAEEAPDLPCFHPGTAGIRQAMAAEHPQRVWHVALRRKDRLVGQCSVLLTEDALGVCGLHEYVVVPDERTSGARLGRFQWVCRFASGLGCRYLVVNGSRDTVPLYRAFGFRHTGSSPSWWLPGGALHEPLDPDVVAFAEAVGGGQLDALEDLVARAGPGLLDAPLANRMSPLQFAAAAGRADSAGWLVERGVRLDVLSAWDLGWEEPARRIAAEDPATLNQRRPRSGKSLLHVAVERGDIGLAGLLLDAGIDVGLRDSRFGSTALEWAQALHRPRLAALIRAHRPVSRR